MSLKKKQMVLCLILIALIVWPLVHHQLVIRYDLNEWRFLGFSMYISKRPYDRYITFQYRGTEVDEASKLEIKAAIERCMRGRREYGKLYNADRLATKS